MGSQSSGASRAQRGRPGCRSGARTASRSDRQLGGARRADDPGGPGAGEFDDLPGAGKPLDLTDNPFAGSGSPPSAPPVTPGRSPVGGAGPEITAEREQLREMGQRSARTCRRSGPAWSLTAFGGSGGPGGPAGGNAGGGASSTAPGPCCGRALCPPALPGGAGGGAGAARRIYLKRAGAIDEKIRDFNTHRPRNLSWLEKPRLPPEVAGQDFDRLCPPFTEPG